jgi:endonuclease-3
MPRFPSARSRAQQLLERLGELYPRATCSLDWRSSYELLIATMFSAQGTDERVNQVTPALFEHFPDAAAAAAVASAEVEPYVTSTGFFRNKAKNIVASSRLLLERHGGVSVDTHVSRLSQRLQLSRGTDPRRIEPDLMKLVPQVEWQNLSIRLIFRSRAVCTARKPRWKVESLNLH